MKTDHPKVPFETIVKAQDGNTDAIREVLANYEGYIAKLSLRPMKDEYGRTRLVIDETLRGRMETNLIKAILLFDIKYENL